MIELKHRKQKNNVVITGIGMICSLGRDSRSVWDMLMAGKPRMSIITAFDAKAYGVEDCVVAQILPSDLEYSIKRFVDKPIKFQKLGRFHTLSLVSAYDAINDAGLDTQSPNNQVLAGIVMGTMSDGVEEIERIVLDTSRSRKPKISDNLGKRTSVAMQNIARTFELCGPVFGIDAACASGAFAVSQAYRLITSEAVPWCLAGGVETPINPSIIKSSHTLGVLATSFSAEPSRASRPFDSLREGFVPAEGACFLILENEEHAVRRGARIYARIASFSELTYPYHPTDLSEEFSERVMKDAIKYAGIPVDKIGCINAHATSTVQGDQIEASAICKVAEGHNTPTTANKSITGHLLGASGAFEIAFSALSLYEQCIPPTINLEYPDPKCSVNCVQNAMNISFEYLLSNSFGFGGSCFCTVLERC